MVTAEQLAARRAAIAGAQDLQALQARLIERAAPVLARMPVIPEHKALLSQDGGSCPDDGTALTFDPWSPGAHRCPRCGQTFTGERHDRHWAKFQHLWIAERAAHLATLGALQHGHVVVVHAAASGVGSAALQLCRGIASVVLATASPGKLDACRELGATHLLARDEVPKRLAEAVRAASGGRGADIIFDIVGGAYLEANVAALALHGRLCCISTLAGSKGTLDIGALVMRRLTVLGSTVRSRSAEQKARLVADFSARALPRFERGELRAVVSRTYPLAEAARAHDDLEGDRVVGKIVLIP